MNGMTEGYIWTMLLTLATRFFTKERNPERLFIHFRQRPGADHPPHPADRWVVVHNTLGRGITSIK